MRGACQESNSCDGSAKNTVNNPPEHQQDSTLTLNCSSVSYVSLICCIDKYKLLWNGLEKKDLWYVLLILTNFGLLNFKFQHSWCRDVGGASSGHCSWPIRAEWAFQGKEGGSLPNVCFYRKHLKMQEQIAPQKTFHGVFKTVKRSFDFDRGQTFLFVMWCWSVFMLDTETCINLSNKKQMKLFVKC